LKKEIFGWAGRILRINLTNGKQSIEPTERYTDRFIGGRGVGQWILLNEVSADISPLNPENRIIFGTGPLTGTLAPATCRLSIDSKNLLTGGVGSSNAGGHFAPELKYAGFDFVVIQGKAAKPVYIWITDGTAEIRDASAIWGKTTWETENFLQREINERVKVLSIGPAGENLVKAACIIVNGARAGGRCGFGAIMGSKNLKAIAIRGTKAVRVAHPEEFIKEVDKAWDTLNKCETIRRVRTKGCYSGIVRTQDTCTLPVRNFQDSHWEVEKLQRTMPSIFEKYKIRNFSGFNCPISCSSFYKVNDGPNKNLECEGFEENLGWDYMAKLDIDNPVALLKIQATCNQLGLDLDNSSGPIAWVFELFQRGIITEKDTDGLKLIWGDYNTVIKLIKKMAYRSGFGNILAEGVKRASEIIERSSEKYAIHIKGQDLAEGIRAAKGWALGVVVAPRGGGHLDGATMTGIQQISKEVGKARFDTPAAGDQRSYEGKAKVVFWFEKFKAIVDMLGMCYFTSLWMDINLLGPEDYAKLFSKATGKKITGNQLMQIGEQVCNIEKAFNTLHKGFKRKDDFPPKRLMKEAINSGPFKGELLEKERWSKMLDEYYNLHKWDKKTGWQTKECLEELGLVEIANILKKAGKLIEKTNKNLISDKLI